MSNGKVLVVEDDKDLRDIYSIILESEGYDVYAATNGLEALSEVKSHKPRLVLLDIFMPILDGKGFLQKLNANLKDEMKIVVCSNTSDDELMTEMVQLGADKVVTKAEMGPQDIASLVRSYMTA